MSDHQRGTDCMHLCICEFGNQESQCPCDHYAAPRSDDSAVVVALRILMDDLGGRVLQSGTVCAVKIARHALDAHDKRQQAKRSGK